MSRTISKPARLPLPAVPSHHICQTLKICQIAQRRLCQKTLPSFKVLIRPSIFRPVLFGRIAALHAMSDIFVSGGTMLNAMAHMVAKKQSGASTTRSFGYAGEAMVECTTHNCTLSGGHSVAGEEASFDLASQAQYQNKTKMPFSPENGRTALSSRPNLSGLALSLPPK